MRICNLGLSLSTSNAFFIVFWPTNELSRAALLTPGMTLKRRPGVG